jgi:hypothetical protein
VPARHDHLDVLGEPFHLFEDVRAEQDRAALGGHAADQVHELEPLARVHAVERLVQEQDGRVVHQGGGHLDALLHALGVVADRAAGGGLHLDQGEGAPRGGAGVGELVQLGHGQDELVAGEEVVRALALGDQAQAAVDARVLPDRGAVERDRPGGRGQEAAHHVDERRLARAVGTQQAGHAGADRHGDAVDRDDVPVPAGHLLQLQLAHSLPARLRGAFRRRLPSSLRSLVPRSLRSSVQASPRPCGSLTRAPPS